MRAAVFAAALGACAGEVAVADPPPTSRSTEPFPPTPGGRPVGRVVSQRFGISLMLPDPKGWSIAREPSSFLVLDHPSSRSRLLVRLWHEPGRMTGDRCEASARSLRDLPDRAGAVEHGIVAVPRGFATSFAVGVTAAATPGAVGGWITAFGAQGRRCFALAFTTEGDDETVGARLAVIRSRTLEELREVDQVGVGQRGPTPVNTVDRAPR